MKSRWIFLSVLILFNMGCIQVQEKRDFKPAVDFVKAEKLDEDEFWRIIDYSYNASKGDMEIQNQIIIKRLSKYAPDEVINFEVILCKKLIEANQFKMVAANQIIDNWVSDDGFLYFRLWLISLGRNTFETVMKNPDDLADVINTGVVPDFEYLLYASTEAYKIRTGKKEDNTFPRDVAFGKGLNYDYGGPPTTGNEIKEEDLPKLFPKLWKKFR